MKVVIVSDNHYQEAILSDILEREFDADLFLHCGDSQLQKNNPVMEHFISVRGNNDFEHYKDHEIVEFGKSRALITHGHHFNVDYTMDELAEYAKSNDAQFAFFGHTHMPISDQNNSLKVQLINPGSTSYPRGILDFGTYVVVSSESTEPNSWSVQFKKANTGEKISLFELERKHKKWWQL